MARPALLLAFETPEACLARLLAEGFAPTHAREIASYLDQAADIAPEFEAIGVACEHHGLGFLPVPLDGLADRLTNCDPAETLVWTLTDGTTFFRGSAAPALAGLAGFRCFGAEAALFFLAQDKFRSGAVLASAGLPVPPAGLARNGEWLVRPTASEQGWFVKPNRLGAKIGIWEDSRCRSEKQALDLSRRIFAAYRDDAIVQAYAPGGNVRASFLAVEAGAGMERLGIAFVEAGGDFQTMADSLALYGETGGAAKAAGRYCEPKLSALAAAQPEADRRIRVHAAQLARTLGLRDVFSLDFRVDADGTVRLLEFEVCPGLPCFDFRSYCRAEWKLDLAGAMAGAMAGAAAARLSPFLA